MRVKARTVSLVCKTEDAFLTYGYTYWKDLTGGKRGTSPTYYYTMQATVEVLL